MMCNLRLRKSGAFPAAGLFVLVLVPLLAFGDRQGSAPASRERSASPSYAGQWLIDAQPGTNLLSMTLRYPGEDGWQRSNEFMISLDGLNGLTKGQMGSDGQTVRFQLIRAPGVFKCEGSFNGREGSGGFEFVPDPRFSAELERRGIGSPSGEQLLEMALNDTSLALVDELKGDGYGVPSLDELVRLGRHGVRLVYVQGIRQLGYNLKSIDLLIAMRDHGVSLDYIKGLISAGYAEVAPNQLIRTRDHGVTTEYINGMKSAGYGHLALDALVQARDHGVTPEFLKSLGDAGYKGVPMEDLIRLRDHGVTPAYIRRLQSHGISNLSVAEIIRLKNHGID